MEACQLQTVADLLASQEERVELIDGEIVRRPMARGEHGSVQLRTGVNRAESVSHRSTPSS